MSNSRMLQVYFRNFPMTKQFLLQKSVSGGKNEREDTFSAVAK